MTPLRMALLQPPDRMRKSRGEISNDKHVMVSNKKCTCHGTDVNHGASSSLTQGGVQLHGQGERRLQIGLHDGVVLALRILDGALANVRADVVDQTVQRAIKQRVNSLYHRLPSLARA
jgi:hypothetical protein